MLEEFETERSLHSGVQLLSVTWRIDRRGSFYCLKGELNLNFQFMMTIFIVIV